jgi:hypothetical protein
MALRVIPLDDAWMSKKQKDKISKTQAFIAVKKDLLTYLLIVEVIKLW